VTTSTGTIAVVAMARSKPPPGGAHIATRGDEHVDDLACLVDRAVDVAPSASDLHVGFVNLPAATNGMAAGPGGVGQQWRESLDSAVDGDVVDLHAAFGEQLLHIAVPQRKAHYQRTASTITSGGKQKPAKTERAMAGGRARRVLMATVCLRRARSQQMQQRPSTTPAPGDSPPAQTASPSPETNPHEPPERTTLFNGNVVRKRPGRLGGVLVLIDDRDRVESVSHLPRRLPDARP
jgi:hypothetical protein